MNPDTSKSSMTVNSLMQWGVAISIAVPIILFALLAFISLNADHNALLYVDTAFAFITLIVVFGVNQWVQRRVRERLASLADNQIKECPSCSKVLRGEERFCFQCGLNLSSHPQLENCRNCNKKI